MKSKAPIYIWIAWGSVVLDVLGFFAVVVDYKWGPVRGEGALGCLGITGLAFLPLLVTATVLTVLWRRSIDRRVHQELAFKAKVRDIRNRREE